MACAGVDFLCAADLDDRLCRAAERACGVDHIVKQNAGLALDIADDVHDLGLIRLLAALIDDSHIAAELHREVAGAGGAADVGRYDHYIVIILAENVDVMLCKERRAEKIVNRDIKEALDLSCVEIHGQDGVEICFDIRFPELTRAMAKRGAEVILCPAQFNMTTGPRHWELSVRARAMDNELFFVGASAARYEGFDYECWGHSTVADPFGMVTASCDEKEQILYCDVDLNEVDSVREQLPTFLHLREDVYNVAK